MFKRIVSFLIINLIQLYRLTISPFLGYCCRFYPTCSEYAQEAFLCCGLTRGFWLTIKRLLRCHPFCEGGFDPVPKKMFREKR